MLALSSRGDVLVVAVLLGLCAARLESGVAAFAAGTSVLLRWGSTSLGALAGAQSVLGPAGLTGPTTVAASSWVAAAALVLACRPPVLLGALPFGAVAAAVATGPGPDGELVWRIAGTAAATLLSAGVARFAPRWVAYVAVAVSLAALPLAVIR